MDPVYVPPAAGNAPISASVHVTLPVPSTDLPVSPYVSVRELPQVEVVMSAEPLKEAPLMVLATCSVVAVVALPESAAVTVPALKLPDASLATIVLAVFALVALLVTVIVAFYAEFDVNVPDPLRPVPEVLTVSVALFTTGN